jgi:hypothetical protein
MNTNRYTKIFAGLLILVVAFVSVSFVSQDMSSKKASGNARSTSSNTYLPLPPGKQTQLYQAAREARILYHRSSSAKSASALVYSDYFERHPELSNLADLGQGASDYAERHPELSAKADSSIDLTDYYFRHLSK